MDEKLYSLSSAKDFFVHHLEFGRRRVSGLKTSYKFFEEDVWMKPASILILVGPI